MTKSEIVNPKSEIRKSRSSVWLEHYTDNVGVSSSNLLGTTRGVSRESKVESTESRVRKGKDLGLKTWDLRLIIGGISSAG